MAKILQLYSLSQRAQFMIRRLYAIAFLPGASLADVFELTDDRFIQAAEFLERAKLIVIHLSGKPLLTALGVRIARELEGQEPPEMIDPDNDWKPLTV
jgi:hypothetical protein